MDTARRHGGSGVVRFSGLNMTHGESPPRPWPTYPNVDQPLVTMASVMLSRYISAIAFMSCVVLPDSWCSSWLGWCTRTTTPVAVGDCQYLDRMFSYASCSRSRLTRCPHGDRAVFLRYIAELYRLAHVRSSNPGTSRPPMSASLLDPAMAEGTKCHGLAGVSSGGGSGGYGLLPTRSPHLTLHPTTDHIERTSMGCLFGLNPIAGRDEDDDHIHHQATVILIPFAFHTQFILPNKLSFDAIANGNTVVPSSSWSALWSAAASASSTSGYPRPSRSKPPHHQLLLEVLFKTPQELRRMEHRGERSTSSSPTSAAGVNLRFPPLR
uniref:Uncharacterized protein n=1 Tax=Oryza meridionalis TaxID=40149 RepID=A0A0E0DYS4_9ORYZ